MGIRLDRIQSCQNWSGGDVGGGDDDDDDDEENSTSIPARTIDKMISASE